MGPEQVAAAGEPVLPPGAQVEFRFGVEGGIEGHDVGTGSVWVGPAGGPARGGVEPHPGSRDLAIDAFAAASRDISEGAGRETLDSAQFCTGLSPVKQACGVQSVGMHGESAERMCVVSSALSVDLPLSRRIAQKSRCDKKTRRKPSYET